MDSVRSTTSAADRVFADYLARSSGGDPALFAEVCAQNETIADELRSLHHAYELAARVLAQERTEVAEGALSAQLTYPVIEEINRGGMGSVFRVHDPVLGRELAIKRTLPGADRARFLRECRIVGRLDHPAIVPVHAHGVDAQGNPWFSMKLVRGEDLAQVITREKGASPSWPLARYAGVLARVCEALEYAHAQGIVHRDVKPSNIMVGSFGEVYLMDWGLAAAAGDTTTDSHAPQTELNSDPALLRTQAGEVIGTLAFMAPEAADGTRRTPDPRLDIYGIGAVLYNILEGGPPYGRGRSPQDLLQALRTGPPPALKRDSRRRPRALIAICERAMAREPEQRYQSASELADDLRAWIEGGVVSALESGWIAEARKWVLRNRVTTAFAALLLIAVPATGYLYWQSRAVEPQLHRSREAEKWERAQAATRRGFAELYSGGKGAEQAKAQFEAALRDRPDYGLAAFGAAVATAKTSGSEAALAAFNAWYAVQSASEIKNPERVRNLLGKREGEEPLQPDTSLSPVELFIEADLLRGNKDPDSFRRAAEYLKRALERSEFPVAVVYDALLHVHTCLGNEAEAEAISLALEKHWPDDAFALVCRSNSQRNFGRAEAAAELARRATVLRPEWEGGWIALAHALRESAQREAALEAIIEAERRGRLGRSGTEIKAQVLISLNRFQDAESLLREALGEDPDYGLFWSGLGHALFYQGRHAECVPCFDRAQKLLEASGPDATFDSVREMGSIRAFRGLAHRRLGNQAAAREDLEAAVLGNPKIDFAWENLALLRCQAQEIESALVAAERAVALSPEVAAHHSTLGYVLIAAKRHRDALAPLGRAVALDPNHAEAWNHLGTAAWFSAEPERSVEAYAKALTLSPLDGKVLTRMLESQIRMGRTREALESFAAFVARGGQAGPDQVSRKARAEEAERVRAQLDQGWSDAAALLDAARKQSKAAALHLGADLYARILELNPAAAEQELGLEAATGAARAGGSCSEPDRTRFHRLAISWVRAHAQALRRDRREAQMDWNPWFGRLPLGNPMDPNLPETVRSEWAALAEDLREPAR